MPEHDSVHDEMLTVAEAADALPFPVTVRTLYREMAAGRLAYYGTAGRRFISRADLDAYVTRCRVPAAS